MELDGKLELYGVMVNTTTADNTPVRMYVSLHKSGMYTSERIDLNDALTDDEQEAKDVLARLRAAESPENRKALQLFRLGHDHEYDTAVVSVEEETV